MHALMSRASSETRRRTGGAASPSHHFDAKSFCCACSMNGSTFDAKAPAVRSSKESASACCRFHFRAICRDRSATRTNFETNDASRTTTSSSTLRASNHASGPCTSVAIEPRPPSEPSPPAPPPAAVLRACSFRAKASAPPREAPSRSRPRSSSSASAARTSGFHTAGGILGPIGSWPPSVSIRFRIDRKPPYTSLAAAAAAVPS